MAAVVQPTMNGVGGFVVAGGLRQRRATVHNGNIASVVPIRSALVTMGRSRGSRRMAVEAASPAYGANKPTPPRDFMRFNVKKTLRVPVEEPASVRASAPPGGSRQSLEQWVQSPGNIMGIVFTADYVTQLEPDFWRIQVLKLPLMEWELSPEFDLAILPPEASARPGGVRMISDELRLSGAAGTSKLPPGFANMPIWTHIDTTLYIERVAGKPTAVCSDLDIGIAADIPGMLRMIPYFQEIGEGAISGSIDVVGAGAQRRVQRAYDQWVKQSAAAEAAEGATTT